MTVLRRWSLPERFLLYGVVGFAAEICFTAVWDAVENGNRKLIGVTSMYVFFVYGVAITALEFIYRTIRHHVPLLLRAVIYTAFCYSWELTFGMFLKQWDACPWDYASYFTYHFMGAITAEYIPVWYLATIICEKLVIKPIMRAYWQLESHHSKSQ